MRSKAVDEDGLDRPASNVASTLEQSAIDQVDFDVSGGAVNRATELFFGRIELIEEILGAVMQFSSERFDALHQLRDLLLLGRRFTDGSSRAFALIADR